MNHLQENVLDWSPGNIDLLAQKIAIIFQAPVLCGFLVNRTILRTGCLEIGSHAIKLMNAMGHYPGNQEIHQPKLL